MSPALPLSLDRLKPPHTLSGSVAISGLAWVHDCGYSVASTTGLARGACHVFLAMLILTMAELDRGNISNAITDRFREDIGITQDEFNVGQQMLSLGIVLFEIPSNMILYRIGPGKWLTLQLFLFGTVSTFQAFQNSYGSFIATRLLLGITESGFIPGEPGSQTLQWQGKALIRHLRWAVDFVDVVHAERNGKARPRLLYWWVTFSAAKSLSWADSQVTCRPWHSRNSSLTVSCICEVSAAKRDGSGCSL